MNLIQSRMMAVGFLLAMLLHAGSVPAEPVHPYESAEAAQPANRIDELVLARLTQEGIEPTLLCSDEVFLRRAYIDVIGTLPETDEVLAFLKDTRADKRERLIDELMQREEFADYWALKWCDLLRVKAEFPINLWPNAVQAYHRWVRDAVKNNMPYDQFARELLTSSGSNFRVPPVNFYRALQGREPSTLATAAALTFMGTRLDSWAADDRTNLEACFSRVAFKKTAEWKEEIVYLDPSKTTPLEVTFPDGTKAQVPPYEDPREAFANWLIAPENPWFTRAITNRTWSWLMGRGIIHEPDDIRADNPPANPELLAYLEQELIAADYDLRHLYRLILTSRTYQQSSIARSDSPQAAALFACYPVRRLDAEVLLDALNRIGGTGEGYSSPIPEPFTFVPEEHRTIELTDGSISSQFLEMFGRPARDMGLESERNLQPTDEQRLYLLNSSEVQKKVEQSPRVRRLLDKHRKNPPEAVRQIYLMILSREPTPDERKAVIAYAAVDGRTRREAGEDLAWALVNTKEFLYRH